MYKCCPFSPEMSSLQEGHTSLAPELWSRKHKQLVAERRWGVRSGGAELPSWLGTELQCCLRRRGLLL